MPPEETASAREWDLRDYLDLALRRKVLILSLFLLTFLATAAWQFTRTPLYGAFSSFVIDESANTSGVGSERYNPYAYWMERGKPIEYYQAIMGSPLYIDRVKNRALTDEALNRAPGSAEEWIVEAIESISLSMDDKSQLMTISVRARTPLMACRVAQYATEHFRARIQEIDAESAQDVVRFIDKQRQEAQERLEEAERALQQYSGAGDVIFIGEDGGMMSKVAQVESILEQAETERRLAESNLASFSMQLAGTGKPGGVLQSAESVPEVIALRERLEKLENQRNALTVAAQPDSAAAADLDRRIEGGKNELRHAILAHSTEALPAEDKKVEELRTMLTNRLVAEQVNLSSTRNRERFYNNLLEEYRRQSPERLEKTMELARLRRTQAVHQNLLNYLVERHEEAKIKAATGAGGLRIVNPPAVPEAPLSRNIPRALLIGAMLGLGLGFGLAMLQEYLDQTVRTREDLERLTGVHVVGQIPLAVRMNGKSSLNKSGLLQSDRQEKSPGRRTAAGAAPPYYPLINKYDPHAPFAEAFRSLRTDLQFYNIDKPLRKLLITSSIPGEGKTLVTANLGMAFAELGHNVVILDADIRKPRQSTVFGVERKPGFTDYFMDLVPFEAIVRSLPVRGLDLIPSGTVPPNPGEVLNSQRMADLIERLEEEYDYVLVDAPPLLSISDAKALSRVVENLLMVFRFARTEKHYVREAVANLLQIKASIVGFVFNGIDASHGKGYYKYYYYSEYREKFAASRMEKVEVN
jgi:tyrosine-protein kinase Etk/Wzc